MSLSKVRGGTPKAENLCRTCTKAHIFEELSGKEYIRCSAGFDDFVIRRDIVRCSDYIDKRDTSPDIRTLASMAYILTENGPLKTVGFLTPEAWKDKKEKTGERTLPDTMPDYLEP